MTLKRNLPAFAMRRLVLVSAVLATSCGGSSGGERPEPGEVETEQKPAELTLDLGERFQTLEGFGAAIAWYDNWLVEHPNKAKLYDVVFEDLGLDMLRLRNRFRYQADFAEGLESIEIVEAGRESLGRDLTVLLSSWSPPRSLKANGAEDCRDGDSGPCTLARENGEFPYAGFADYWLDSLEAYRDVGIEPRFISIQNEPDFSPNGWEGCVFAPEETSDLPSYARALGEVNTRLEALDDPPLVLGPETIGIANGKVQDYLQAMNTSHIYGIAHHLYHGDDWLDPDSFSGAMQGIRQAYPQYPVFQTEFSVGPGDSPGGAMFETAWLIHNSLVDASAVAYVYWDLIWARPSGLVALEFPGAEDNWSTEQGYEIRPPYYAVRHFASFTDPGYVRVGIDSSSLDVKASAFESPSGDRLTVVVLNTARSARQALFDLAGARGESRIYQSTSDSEWRSRGALPESGELDLPARSITTLVLDE